jgi:hypothetical protein
MHRSNVLAQARAASEPCNTGERKSALPGANGSVSVLLCGHGLHELGPVIYANSAHQLSDIVICFFTLFRVVLNKRCV